MQPATDTIGLPSVLVIAVLALVGAILAFTGQQLMVILALVGAAGVLLIWKYPHLGILVFLSTFLFRYPDFLQGYGYFTINNVLGAFFCLLLLVHVLEHHDLWALRDVRIRLLLAIAAVFLVSTWLARDPPPGLSHLDRTGAELWEFFTQLAFVAFMIHFIRTREHLGLVFGLLLLAIIVSGLSALLISGTDYRASASYGIDAAGNSNRLGFYCLVGIAILWYLRQDIKSRAVKAVLLGLSGMLLMVVFLTASRSALIGAVVLGGILAVEAGVQPGRLIVAALMTGAIGFLLIQVVPTQNLQRITSFGVGTEESSEAAGSADKRLQVAQVALEVYSDSNLVLGVGPGNFRWIRQLDYDLQRLSFHSGYLWALLSGGAAALALYLALYWSCWRDLRWLERRPPSPSKPPLWMIKSTRTMLLLLLVFSLFAEVWLEVIPFLIFALTIVMLRMESVEMDALDSI